MLMSLETDPLRDLGRGVWVHGCGGFGRSVARALADSDCRVLGFLDRKGGTRKDGAEIDGLAVLHPEAIDDFDVAGAFHVHGLMNHYASSREVTDWAIGRGFEGLLFPADLYRVPGFTCQNYWLGPPTEMLAHLDAIEQVYDSLADGKSRSLFVGLIRYRLTTDPRLHPRVETTEAYAPDFLPIFDRPITFIDGGAYTGDTLESLLACGVAVKDWIAFEPDARNMRALRATAQRNAARVASITLSRHGLSDRAERVAFADGEGETSHLIAVASGEPGTTWIDVMRLDDAIDRKTDVYVKLDIEGAEMAALRGMPRLLMSSPTLAVSIYHKPNDLWEVALYLRKEAPKANFRIRQYNHHGFDTVLYVSPD